MKKRSRFLAAILTLGLVAGCTPRTTSPSPTAPSPSPGEGSTPSPEIVETLKLTREEFPQLDGSTSTAPLAQAVCAVLLGEEREAVADLVNFSRTTQSYRNLLNEHSGVELLIAAEPAQSVVQEKEEAKFEWEMAPIATDALVFLVNEDNPVDNLTIQQVQKIYTGEITNWKEVGGEDREIIPFQRNAEAGSQTLMQKLVMGELELMEPEREYIVTSMSGLIEAVRSFDGSPGAIGYTVYYYANDMNMAEGLKVVSIDGAAPDAASIRSGDYPFTNPYYATIAADEPADSPARQVFEWLQGPIGQSLIQHEGYVSILDDPAPVEWDLGETEPLVEKYTRLSADPMPELIPSDEYGDLLSYVGAIFQTSWGEGYYKYGLVTREGMMVTDPVYDGVGWVSYYDADMGSVDLGILRLTRTIDTPEAREQRVALAARDGSWVTGFDWLYVWAAAPDRLWAVELDGDGVMLDLDLNELWRLPLPEGQEKWLYQGDINGTMYWNGGVGAFYADGYQAVDLEGNFLSLGENGVVDIMGFHDGLAAAHTKDNWDTWGYINEEGEWVIEPRFDLCWDFHNGKAIVSLGGAGAIIDTEGNILLEADGQFLRRESARGDWYLNYTEVPYENGGQGYLIGGVYDEDLRPLEWDWIGETAGWGSEDYLWRATEEGLALGNPYETIAIPSEREVRLDIQTGDLLICIHETEGDPIRWSVWNTAGECVFPEEEQQYVSVITDNETGKHYIYTEKSGRYSIYDQEGNFLTDCDDWPMITDGLISVHTALSYGYKTMDGEWVFRISLMKSQED